MQGITKEKYSDPGFHNCYRKHSFFACIDRKRGNDDIELDGFKAYYSPRTELQNGKSLRCTDGGVVLFVAEDIADSYFVMDHTTEAFPEVAAVEFLGSLFGLENNVIIIATYISCSNLDASQRYLETHHISQTMALADFIRAFRLAGFEIVLCGDFNAYTIDHAGFTETESEFHDTLPDECDWPIRRNSACTHLRRNQNGKELIALCQSCELVVMNGALVNGKFFDSGCTRDSHRVTGGSVIDYVLASPRIFPRLVSLRVSNPGYSDHNAFTLGWLGKDPQVHAKDRNKVNRQVSGKPSSGPKGWCFLDSLPEDKQNNFVAHLAADPRLREIATVCEGDDFTQDSAEFSLRRLHELIRDAWGACGLKVHIISGKTASSEPSNFANSIPIASWMDDECRAARAVMHRAKRRKKEG